MKFKFQTKDVLKEFYILQISAAGSYTCFVRHTEVVVSVSRIPGKQYLMREPKLRAFFDSMLDASKLADQQG